MYIQAWVGMKIGSSRDAAKCANHLNMRQKLHDNEIFFYASKNFFSAAATIKLNGLNSLSLRYPVGLTNEADDITIRFRSIEQAGLLMTTRHDRSQDKLELSLESARVRVTLQVLFIILILLL